MTPHRAAIFSYSVLVLSLVWIAVFTAWRSYRVSALQQRLSVLRAHLSDLAARLGFSTSALQTRQLQTLLEAASRQAGLMTFTRFQLTYLASRLGFLNPRPVPAWLDHPELGAIHEEMRAVIARHVISGCPLLWIFLSAAISAAFSPAPFDANSARHVRLVPGLIALDELLLGAQGGTAA